MYTLYTLSSSSQELLPIRRGRPRVRRGESASLARGGPLKPEFAQVGEPVALPFDGARLFHGGYVVHRDIHVHLAGQLPASSRFIDGVLERVDVTAGVTNLREG